MPTYEEIQLQARDKVNSNKKTLLNKRNYQIIQRTLMDFAAAADFTSILNYTEKKWHN